MKDSVVQTEVSCKKYFHLNNKMAYTPGSQTDDLGFASRPKTVSSTSSMETAASMQKDIGNISDGSLVVSVEPSIVRSFPQQTHTTVTENYKVQTSANTATPSASIGGLTQSRLRSPTASVVFPSATNANTVPEFLYQLTKMLTDNNRDIIEWSNGKNLENV